MMDGAIIGLALAATTQGSASFGQYLPKFSEIRKGDPEGVARDVRMGEIAAMTTTMSVGVIASYLSGSQVPALTAALMCLVMVALFEYALREMNDA